MQRWITSQNLPEWLRNSVVIFGADPEGEGGNEGEGEGSEGEGGEGESEGENEGDDKSEGGKPEPEDDKEELKRALRAERRQRKALEKELVPLKQKATQKTEEETEDLNKTKEELEASNTKVARLGEKLLTRSLDSAIREEARKQNFIDVSDALAGVDRSQIDFDQDEEDPSDIDIDAKSVAEVVKDLAKRKKHLIKAPGGGNPSGGRGFGGGNGTGNQDSNKQNKLLENYPSLRV